MMHSDYLFGDAPAQVLGRGETAAGGVWISAGRIWLKRWLKTALAVPGVLAMGQQPAIRCLFYHRINPYPFSSLGPVSREISISPEEFEWQIRYLAENGHRSITLAQFHAWLCGDAPIDDKSILITFDDGYEDNLSWAAPILKRHGFSATVFVVTDFLGSDTRSVWPHADPPAQGRFLSPEQLCHWRDLGFEIGSHTLDHPLLTRLSPGDLFEQLSRSRHKLEALLGASVFALAYPGGDFNRDVEDAAAAAGYLLGFTTIPGRNPRGSRPFALRRTEVSASDSRFVFRMKMAGHLDWLWLKECSFVRAALRLANRALMPLVKSGG
jgi:peptidoglycan/xylan/chitin deacetylase (PgdA/CDA1 family)